MQTIIVYQREITQKLKLLNEEIDPVKYRTNFLIHVNLENMFYFHFKKATTKKRC